MPENKKPYDIKCMMCGTCCTVYDIAEIKKPVLKKCEHLDENNLCKIHETKPWACAGVKPDELCVLMQDLSEEDRVEFLRRIYGIE